jgi:uncharacterized protein YlzI (FlbEa/FlbD family)
MIELHRLNGTAFFLNGELIKLVERAPDTLITLVVEGEKLRVRETPEQIARLVAEMRADCRREYRAPGV